jgi:hypothetical protein
MRPEALKLLHDVRQACQLLEDFTRGKTFADYLADALLRAGVEREFIVIGEAFTQAGKLEPDFDKVITGKSSCPRVRRCPAGHGLGHCRSGRSNPSARSG